MSSDAQKSTTFGSIAIIDPACSLTSKSAIEKQPRCRRSLARPDTGDRRETGVWGRGGLESAADNPRQPQRVDGSMINIFPTATEKWLRFRAMSIILSQITVQQFLYLMLMLNVKALILFPLCRKVV